MMRDYDYLHQRVHLDVDVLNKQILGVSESFLSPKVGILPTVRLHARQLKVNRVLVNGIEAEFEHLNFMHNIVSEKYRDLAAYDLFYRGTIVASKEGELIVQLPKGVKILPVENHAAFNAAPESEEFPTHARTAIPASSTSFQPICVRVEYTLKDPRGGVRFMLPDTQHPMRSPHMYTYCGSLGGLCDGARTWMPCRDTLRDTCTFRIEVKVPLAFVAISSGELLEQTIDASETSRSFLYAVNCATTASCIAIVVGPFQMYVPDDRPSMTYFCLPEKFEQLENTIRDTSRAMTKVEKILNAKYPFGFYQQVFVEDPPEKLQWFAGASILDQCVLHPATVVDPQLGSHLLQVKGIIGSWIGAGVGLHTSKDAWVLVGLVGYLLNVYVREAYGLEAHGYRIQMAMDALVTLEMVHKGPSLALLSSEVDVYEEYTPYVIPFLEVKAPLVMHMIECKVTLPRFMSAIQQVVCGVDSISSSLSSSVSSVSDQHGGSDKRPNSKDRFLTKSLSVVGDEENVQLNKEKKSPPPPAAPGTKSSSTTALSTLPFLRSVKTLAGAAGQDLTKNFLTYWILEGSLPVFTIGFWYNRKQTQAEVVLQQEIPPGGKLYTGDITVTIVEELSEFPVKKRIDSKRHKWDFPCHSKIRKKRRKRQGLDDPDDSVSVSGPGMGLNDTPVFWVKIDAEGEWLRSIVMHQPDFNWMEQVLSDKKPLSRFQAVRALALFHQPHEKPNVMSCRVITECMDGLTTHSAVLRTEAALALGNWQTIHAPLTTANTHFSIWKGMHNLFRIFKQHFFDRKKDIPLPNYFVPSGGKVEIEVGNDERVRKSTTNIQVEEYAKGEYEIKKAIPRALASIHAQNGITPAEIEEFLLQLLMENDNSKNYLHMENKNQLVDDCYYLGTLIVCLSTMKLDPKRKAKAPAGVVSQPTTGSNGPTGTNSSSTGSNRGEGDVVVREILRCLQYDQVSPSYQNVITVCCLEALCNLILAGRCPGTVPFHQYAAPNHEVMVREAAIESIVRLYLAEDPHTTTKRQTDFYGAKANGVSQNAAMEYVYGPVAAFQWVSKLLKVEESPRIRLFAVQALMDGCKGYSPRRATETLATWQHPYIIKMRSEICAVYPKLFLSVSPERSMFEHIFTPVDLSPLTENTRFAREIVEQFWSILNGPVTETDQRLRVALIVLYRYVWGEDTPAAVAQSVETKPKNWAGGYETLRSMIEEVQRNKFRTGAVPDKRSAPPPSSTNGIVSDDFKGKKFKITLGDQTVRSHRM